MTLYCYHNSHSDEVYRRICKTLRKEYGLFTLYAHSTSYLDEMSNLLLKQMIKESILIPLSLLLTI